MNPSNIVFQNQTEIDTCDWVAEFVTYEKGAMRRYKSYGKTKEESENKEFAELIGEYECDVFSLIKLLEEERS